MPIPLTPTTTEILFIDELQDAVYGSRIPIAEIAKKCDVEENRIWLWMTGQDLPATEVQQAFLKWVEEVVV
jgi:hypothetical protein